MGRVRDTIVAVEVQQLILCICVAEVHDTVNNGKY